MTSFYLLTTHTHTLLLPNTFRATLYKNIYPFIAFVFFRIKLLCTQLLAVNKIIKIEGEEKTAFQRAKESKNYFFCVIFVFFFFDKNKKRKTLVKVV